MKPGEYIILKKANIEEKIKDLEIKISRYKSQISINIAKGKISALKSLLSNPKDLYDVVEDACGRGMTIGHIENEYTKEVEKQDYLNNLEL